VFFFLTKYYRHAFGKLSLMYVTISFTEIERSIGHNLYTLNTNSLLGLQSLSFPHRQGLGTLSLLRYTEVNAINISSNKCNLIYTFYDIHQHRHVYCNMYELTYVINGVSQSASVG
jgi:hypothetical protein